jgi:hypothetical protein
VSAAGLAVADLVESRPIGWHAVLIDPFFDRRSE